ncbi:hypothetical protein [Actinorhabdospora filicis]|nr:hypothetical protein [Actinorhabdospora filicis]
MAHPFRGNDDRRPSDDDDVEEAGEREARNRAADQEDPGERAPDRVNGHDPLDRGDASGRQDTGDTD